MYPLLTTAFHTFATCTKPRIFGLETWYAYFPQSWFGGNGGGPCSINTNFQVLPQNGESGLLLIALAVIDDLIRIAALVAVSFVIYGGFQYMTSNGSPDATKRAQNSIINALVGLVIAILAASIVSFIGNRLGS